MVAGRFSFTHDAVADLAAFGSVARPLEDQDRAARMGQAAHAHVRDQYVGDMHLLRYAKLLGSLIGGV